MGENSKIEWTHHTFNPWWGCVKVSPGCAHCYAETFSKRYGHNVWGVHAKRRFFGAQHWNLPVKWNREAEKAGERRRVFCASMADVFEHYDTTLAIGDKMELARYDLWRLIEKTPALDWLLLTKRPQNIMHMIPYEWRDQLPANVWIGATAENQEQADERIPELLKVPAVVRFLSCEPLLGPVDLRAIAQTGPVGAFADANGVTCVDVLAGRKSQYAAIRVGGRGDRSNAFTHGWNFAGRGPRIHWVICGGESGPGARPMHPDWARSLRDQCRLADVPFFFKQWGEFISGPIVPDPQFVGGAYVDTPFGDTTIDSAHVFDDGKTGAIKLGKKVTGRVLDDRTWDEFPAVEAE